MVASLSQILERLEGQAHVKAVHSLGQPCSSAFCLFNSTQPPQLVAEGFLVALISGLYPNLGSPGAPPPLHSQGQKSQGTAAPPPHLNVPGESRGLQKGSFGKVSIVPRELGS